MIKRVVSLLLISFLVAFCVTIYCFDSVVHFSINHLTGYRIAFDKWGEGPFDRRHVQRLRLEEVKSGFIITAETVYFTPKFQQSLDAKKLILDCWLGDVRFRRKEKAKTDGPAVNTLLAVPFDTGWQYRSMAFTIIFDGRYLRIDEFMAFSDNIKMKGDYKLAVIGGDFLINVNMSVSPEIAESSMGDFKDMLLVMGEKGWYGSEFSLEGNAGSETLHVKSDRLEINISAK